MKLYLYLFVLLTSSFTFAQELDTVSKKSYDEELELLKNRINQLEALSKEKVKQEENKSTLIDRSKLSFDAIMRLGEMDWNQHNMDVATGEKTKPSTRFWSRAMFYLNLDTDITEQFSFRSSIMAHPYFAFGGESDSKLAIMLNELWVEYKPTKNQAIRFGRQTASRIWDNHIGEQFDWINHDGISYVSNYKFNSYLLNLKSALFIEKYVDNASFKKQGKMYGVSAELQKNNPTNTWKVSSGLLLAERLPNTYYSNISGFIYPGDLAPDYSIWTNHLDVKFKQLSNLNFNVNVFYNFKKYKTNPPSNLITDKSGNNYFSDNNAFVTSEAPDFTKQNFGIYGNVGVDFSLFKKVFKTSLAYLYMEKYAALDYYAQYDLARWNSTNVKGPEFMILCQLNKWMRLRSRNFFMREIKGLNAVDPSYTRSGNRTRLDLIINF